MVYDGPSGHLLPDRDHSPRTFGKPIMRASRQPVNLPLFVHYDVPLFTEPFTEQPPAAETRTAEFSPCRRYRYTLTRRWSDAPVINWIMLNPSTADETENDPTVERCERRARMWGYGGIVVTNIFAWRSTDPSVLPSIDDPVGPGNNAAILRSAAEAGIVVCGWGIHGGVKNRSAAVLKLLEGILLHALKVNDNGEPSHPLYLRYSLQPVIYREGVADGING